MVNPNQGMEVDETKKTKIKTVTFRKGKHKRTCRKRANHETLSVALKALRLETVGDHDLVKPSSRAAACNIGASTSTYGASPSTYSASTSTYSASTSTYGASTSTYGASTSTYCTSTSTYGAPTSTYGACGNTYNIYSGTFSATTYTYVTSTSSYCPCMPVTTIGSIMCTVSSAHNTADAEVGTDAAIVTGSTFTEAH